MDESYEATHKHAPLYVGERPAMCCGAPLRVDPITRIMYCKGRALGTLPTEPQEIDLLHHATTAVRKTREAIPGPVYCTQTVALYSVMMALSRDGDGRFEICEEPDKRERQRPSPDYVLINRDTGALFTVETTQLVTHPSEVKQWMFEFEFISQLCPHLNGRITGTYLLLLPQSMDVRKQQLADACLRIANCMVSQAPPIQVMESVWMPFKILVMKLSNDGAHISWATAVTDEHWGDDPDSFVRDTETCRTQLRPILQEALSKFADCRRGETVVAVYTDLPATIDFPDAARSLQCEMMGIDRLYRVPPKVVQAATRIW